MKTLLAIIAGMFLAFCLFADERVAPKTVEGWTEYRTTTSAYDPLFNYKYYRDVIIMVGPTRKADGYPEPPAMDIRAVIGNIQIISVPVGEICTPEQVPTLEFSGTLFENCQP